MYNLEELIFSGDNTFTEKTITVGFRLIECHRYYEVNGKKHLEVIKIHKDKVVIFNDESGSGSVQTLPLKKAPVGWKSNPLLLLFEQLFTDMHFNVFKFTVTKLPEVCDAEFREVNEEIKVRDKSIVVANNGLIYPLAFACHNYKVLVELKREVISLNDFSYIVSLCESVTGKKIYLDAVEMKNQVKSVLNTKLCTEIDSKYIPFFEFEHLTGSAKKDYYNLIRKVNASRFIELYMFSKSKSRFLSEVVFQLHCLVEKALYVGSKEDIRLIKANAKAIQPYLDTLYESNKNLFTSIINVIMELDIESLREEQYVSMYIGIFRQLREQAKKEKVECSAHELNVLAVIK